MKILKELMKYLENENFLRIVRICIGLGGLSYISVGFLTLIVAGSGGLIFIGLGILFILFAILTNKYLGYASIIASLFSISGFVYSALRYLSKGPVVILWQFSRSAPIMPFFLIVCMWYLLKLKYLKLIIIFFITFVILTSMISILLEASDEYNFEKALETVDASYCNKIQRGMLTPDIAYTYTIEDETSPFYGETFRGDDLKPWCFVQVAAKANDPKHCANSPDKGSCLFLLARIHHENALEYCYMIELIEENVFEKELCYQEISVKFNSCYDIKDSDIRTDCFESCDMIQNLTIQKDCEDTHNMR